MEDYKRLLDRFSRLAEAPARAQEETLSRILKAAADSDYGKEYGFDSCTTIDEFRKRVPISSYEDFRPWLEKDPTALTKASPLAFLSTSASTGQPKLIPYTEAYAAAIKDAHDVFSAGCFHDFPWLPLDEGTPKGLGLYQVGLPKPSMHPEISLDSYVSRLFNVALEEDPFFFGLPRDLYAISDAQDRLSAMLRVAADWDVRAIRATNPTTLLLFSRLLSENTTEFLRDLRTEGRTVECSGERPACAELADRLEALGRPLQMRDLWPNLQLLITWRGGTCHLYEPFLRECYGDDVRIRAPIFAASEGVIAIPLADEMLGGVPALSATFFEFIPLGESGERTLLLHELEVGERYLLLMTSPSGMYRYRIGDVVEVDGVYGNCPTIHFVARDGRTSSLTGEKLTEMQVEEAVASVCERLRILPMFWLLSPVLEARPYYVLSVEWGSERPENAKAFAEAVDAELCKLNIEYRSKRESDRLGSVVLKTVAPGEFAALQARGLSSKSAANFKLPHLTSKALHEELAEE